jgi:hypothetical protein
MSSDAQLQIFRMFRRACDEQEGGPEKQLLSDICRLYGLWQIEEQGASFLKCTFGTGGGSIFGH